MTQSRTALLIVPASNTTVEPEMAALLPGFARQLVARIPLADSPASPEDLPAYAEATIEAVRPYLPDKPDVAIHGCVSAGFLAGPDGNARFVRRLEQGTGLPVVSTADAMVQALRHAGARRIAAVTPYSPAVNDRLRAYLAASGIAIDTLGSLDCPDVAALCAVTERQVLERALATAGAMHDALFIACTQLPTLGILAPLRERLGIPVWSSVSATAWAVARAVPTLAQAA